MPAGFRSVADYGRQIFNEGIPVPSLHCRAYPDRKQDRCPPSSSNSPRLPGNPSRNVSAHSFASARSRPKSSWPRFRCSRRSGHLSSAAARTSSSTTPSKRSRPAQHRTVEVIDRPHPFDLRLGARNARQDQRSCRSRRAIGSCHARSGANRGGPDSCHRRRTVRSRSCRRSRDSRRRSGKPGREGQPGAICACRSNRIDPQPHS